MNKEILFRIIAVVFIVMLIVILVLYYIEIKTNPCKDSSCNELFGYIGDKECFKYQYAPNDLDYQDYPNELSKEKS